MATSPSAPGTYEARYLARVSGSAYAELQGMSELRSHVEQNVSRIKELFTRAVRESAPGAPESCDEADRVDALFAILSTVGRGDQDRASAKDAFRETVVAAGEAVDSPLDEILVLHLRSRALVNRWFAANGGWPLSRDVFCGNIDALRTLRATLATGACFKDVLAMLPVGVREEIMQSAVKPGHTLLTNKLHEDHIVGINHQGKLQSQTVGQPPMFELILSETPKLTVEVAVLKAYTSAQLRAGVPLELIQLVAFAFCHEIYSSLAICEPTSAPVGFANWLDFIAKNPKVEQIKIARTSVVNELYSWYRPWTGSGGPESECMTQEEKQQLLWGIPNVSNSLRLLGMLNFALDLGPLLATAKPECPLPERLPTDGHEFYVPMGVYETMQRKSQALKAEQVQITAGDGFINMMLRKRPKSRKRLLWQTWVGYGAQENHEKLANQRAFVGIEVAATRLLARLGLDDESDEALAAAESIYGVMLEDVVGNQCVSSQRLATILQVDKGLVARFWNEVSDSVTHFARCEPLAGLKELLLHTD